MNDYFEIDFLNVDSKQSGDAIALRYRKNGETTIHVVDGGFQNTGEKIINHINDYYEGATRINHVVVTHPDSDHTGGLLTVLEKMDVDALWMLRPWSYADELIHRFSRFTNVENLENRLREIYPSICELERIAISRGIPIYEPFQGSSIGDFLVLSPSKIHYLDMILESEKTPEIAKSEPDSMVLSILNEFIKLVKGNWGEENFSKEETSAENEMSVVQYASICESNILLTGDAGRKSMTNSIGYFILYGSTSPDTSMLLSRLSGDSSTPWSITEAVRHLDKEGKPMSCIVNKFQVPHHGSRRNLSSPIMDFWLGPTLDSPDSLPENEVAAIISASKEDKEHPKKAVVRACIHRGASVASTESGDISANGGSAPYRTGWTPASLLQYPEDQEE